ncbi:unnamed protein product [Strongylus vulgaris]|uniref:Reverse transcriptase domain-containing protein n=1 Tax=Strongylus vulgaris TaxID=40348 RepID=A0A3P7JPU6_STRVU|nr:unnamed protein product [Strongylus vulgaris]
MSLCKLRQNNETIPQKTGIHQDSLLSPQLFITIMDATTEGLKRQPPWALLYADDVMLMAENRKECEQEVQR